MGSTTWDFATGALHTSGGTLSIWDQSRSLVGASRYMRAQGGALRDAVLAHLFAGECLLYRAGVAPLSDALLPAFVLVSPAPAPDAFDLDSAAPTIGGLDRRALDAPDGVREAYFAMRGAVRQLLETRRPVAPHMPALGFPSGLLPNPTRPGSALAVGAAVVTVLGVAGIVAAWDVAKRQKEVALEVKKSEVAGKVRVAVDAIAAQVRTGQKVAVPDFIGEMGRGEESRVRWEPWLGALGGAALVAGGVYAARG